jgi:putative ubiquitin-RnfH superfamily antitoxin RatB of RatAB toxin-antitoxin module
MKTPRVSSPTERPTKTRLHVEDAHAAVEKQALVRLNVELPEALHRAVKMRALQENRTIRDVVLTLLTNYSK